MNSDPPLPSFPNSRHCLGWMDGSWKVRGPLQLVSPAQFAAARETEDKEGADVEGTLPKAIFVRDMKIVLVVLY